MAEKFEDLKGRATPAKSFQSRRFLTVLLLSIAGPLAIGLCVLQVYVTGGRFVSTENAYVKADKIAVSADVTGRVVEVDVAANQRIEAGTLLFRIDSEPFRIAVSVAAARLAAARQDIAAMKAEYRQKIAERKMASGEAEYYERQSERQRKLNDKGFASRSKLDEAEQRLRLARDQVATAAENLGRVRANLGGSVDFHIDSHPEVMEALAILDEAILALRRTEIRAPSAGVVTNFNLEVGEYIESGKPVFSLVGADRVWVEANFKETELAHIRDGQSATLAFDAYPDYSVQAVVASISPATGAEFALLPPQNASGNWVKVVQRLPVRLELVGTEELPSLRAGMSVIVEVDTGYKRELPWLSNTTLEWMRGDS